MEEWRTLYATLRAITKPVVSALNGAAVGSGFQFALLTDIRIGHPGTRLGQPEINVGLPSITGIWAMWDVLGRSRTTELVLTGRLMNAGEAHTLGVLHHVVPPEEVLPFAIQVAGELAAKPAGAFRINKQRLRELTEAAFVEAEQYGRVAHRAAFLSGEPKAAMDKFLAQTAVDGGEIPAAGRARRARR